MDGLKQLTASFVDFAARRPALTLAASNVVTAFAVLYVLTDGRPIKYIRKQLFKAVLSAVPASIVSNELDKVKRKIEASVIGDSLDGEALVAKLPEQGWDHKAVVDTLTHYGEKDGAHWRSGKISGCIYHGGDSLSAIMSEAFQRFALSNPLHPDIFPSVRKMESEVVSMTLSLFNGGAGGCGTMTSGGTESILVAMKAYRDYARSTRGIRDPELVVPVTAHAAFDKACDYFGIKMVHVPVNPTTFKVEVAAISKAITSNTIAVVASAPTFPHGMVDPIEDIAAVALARGVPMHVDCCLGSFLIPFAEAAGRRALPKFDFRVPGVTSISTDTHKYGYAPKGSSVVLYADNKYRHAQYFVAPEWTGGIYASPTLAGSRPGALVAACWATMVHVGRAGYHKCAEAILAAAAIVTEGVRGIPQLRLCGEPQLSVVAFEPSGAAGSGPAFNIYSLADEMKAQGWNLNILQNPACAHLCVTYANSGSADKFVADLRAAVAVVQAAPSSKYKDGSGAIYGLAASIDDKSLVNEVAFCFLDTLYQTTAPRA